ncbi:MAG: tRNA (guanosine(46)-N7)-methyltransferase TrmB [Clostridia bacterium]|nr:tRNA (guanosine(46)-N7)-methyltransferase TrmB [Clostridia bacterium]
MRQRNRKHLDERLDNCSEIYSDKGDILDEEFLSHHPLHMEIGCGKGRFITTLASLNPDINYIASEMIANIIVLAAEKAKEMDLGNIRFVSGNVQYMADSIPEGSIDRIYLNFSDPWPKDRHAKRRLTHKNFLDLYEKLLAPGGEVHFKTDNRALFDFSLESFKENGWELSSVTNDLHNSGFEGNVMTEYEERFSSLGFTINRLVARKNRE